MKQLLNRALFLLSQRDHSISELRRKLFLRPSFNKGNTSTCVALKRNSDHVAGEDNQIDDQSSVLFSDQQDVDLDNDPSYQSNEHQNQLVKIEAVIQYCIEHNYLDDHKFANQFIRGRSSRGYGPRRIQADLQQKGIAADIASEAIENSEIDWYLLARLRAERKFGAPLANDWKNKAKILRYLTSKGYSYQEINAVFDDQ